MSHVETTRTEQELWHVQMPAGDVRLMSLDELDTAFNEGHVGASTYVCEDGSTEWSMLGALLGIETAPPVSAAVVAPSAVALPYEDRPSVGPNSLRPMVSEIYDSAEIPDLPVRSKAPRVIFGLVAAAMVAAGATFAVKNLHKPIQVAAALPPAADTTDTRVPSQAAPSYAYGASATPRLTDEQKQALLDADKARLAPKPAAPAKKGKKGLGHKGGNKFDPLNGSL